MQPHIGRPQDRLHFEIITVKQAGKEMARLGQNITNQQWLS